MMNACIHIRYRNALSKFLALGCGGARVKRVSQAWSAAVKAFGLRLFNSASSCTSVGRSTGFTDKHRDTRSHNSGPYCLL